MAHEISVPRLGWTMEEGTFGGWLRAEGELVREQDEVFTLESDKATQGIEALATGILRISPGGPRAGDTVKVGVVLGCLVAEGELAPWETAGDTPAPASAPALLTANAPSRQAPTPAVNQAPRGRHAAISPRARRVAGELGVDWSRIAGSGATGRIVERDVRAAASERRSTAPSSVAKAVRKAGRDERIPVTPLRRLIADRMLAGSQATAPVTLTTKADVTQLKAIREQFKSAPPGRQPRVPSFTALMIKLTAAVLEHHPRLNACWEGDHIRQHGTIHVAVAIDTEAGLMAPVIRDVPAQTLLQIAESLERLSSRARERQLRPEEFEGGTFTLTNLGMFGIDAFTPIVNLPQCAILGLGRIVTEPAVHGGQVVPRDQMTLSLSFDHRVVDGAPAARFLNELRQAVEEPFPWLLAE